MKSLFQTLIVLLISTSSFAQLEWESKSSLPKYGRYAGVSFSIDGKIYVGLGRLPDGSYTNDFWEYNPLTEEWTQKANYPGSGLYSCSGFAIGSKGYVGLGYDGTTSHKSFYEYNPSTNTWTAKATFPGLGRHDAVSFTIGNLAYLGTGSCKNRFCYYSDFWSYNSSTDKWTQLANYPGGSTSAAVGFAIGNDGYLGGGKPFSLVVSTAFYKYTVSTNSWAAIASIPSPGVMASSSFVKNNEGYIGCGTTTNSATVLLNDYKKYNPTSNSWTSLTSNSNYSKSLSPNITQINDSVIYSIGGMGKHGELTNVWRLKTSSNPCTHYDTIYVTVQDTLTFKVNIASVAQPQFIGVKVYPNPAGSQVTIAISDFTQLSNYTLKIYNTLGVEVFSQAVTAATYTINTSTIGVAGTYHLEVYDSLNAKRGRKTIIIQ